MIILRNVLLIFVFQMIFSSQVQGGVLHDAVDALDIREVQILIERGCDVDAKDKRGYTALHHAAVQNANNIATLLIDKGANINSKGLLGYSPLHLAVASGSEEIVLLLISKGASLEIQDEDGSTPLLESIILNKTRISRLLVTHGANVNAKALHGVTPLVMSISSKSIETAKLLIENGADVNVKVGGQSPLFLAAAKNLLEIVKLLLQHGADVNHKESYKNLMPLDVAVEQNLMEMAKLLIENGADLNAISGDEHYTPLYRAAVIRSKEMAALLIRSGADLNTKCRNGRTPVDEWPALLSIKTDTSDEVQRQSTKESTKEQKIAPLTYVYIKPGIFIMGSPEDEQGSMPSDKPQHQVSLSRGILMMQTEVTRGIWDVLKSITGRLPDDPSDPEIGATTYHPVNSVTWNEAILFANVFSEATKSELCYFTDPGFSRPVSYLNYRSRGPFYCNFEADGFRLPTEAEWEYACRAGTTGAFSCAENFSTELSTVTCVKGDLPILENYCIFCANSSELSAEVASKLPNQWGLYDMHGNVSEWCWDRFGAYTPSGVVDPTGSDDDSRRIHRGGSFNGNPWYCRSALRGYRNLNSRYATQGFRLVKTVWEYSSLTKLDTPISLGRINEIVIGLLRDYGGITDWELPPGALFHHILGAYEISNGKKENILVVVSTTNTDKNECTACSEKLSFFEFNIESNDQIDLRNSSVNATSYGRAARDDFRVIKIGENKLGIVAEWTGGRMGDYWCGLTIFGVVNGKYSSIFSTQFASGFSESPGDPIKTVYTKDVCFRKTNAEFYDILLVKTDESGSKQQSIYKFKGDKYVEATQEETETELQKEIDLIQYKTRKTFQP